MHNVFTQTVPYRLLRPLDHNIQGDKNGTLFVRLITSSNIDQFSDLFTVRIKKKCVIILSLKIPPHLMCVAKLLCEMSMS